MMQAAIVGVASPTLLDPEPILVWNATASVPLGLYAIRAVSTPRVGDLVAVRPPKALAEHLAQDGYLPFGAPLLKPVAALSGQTVCRAGLTITIDRATAVQARERDHAGRTLPIWRGCRTLDKREIFLLNREEPASLDGRYFGPLPTSSIIGRAVPLWTW